VQLRAGRQPRLLRVLGDHAVDDARVLERPPHQEGVGDAGAVVAEDAHAGAGAGHRDELRELLPLPPLRHRADGAHIDVPGLVPERGDLLDDAGAVGGRGGVRHRVDRGEAAGSRGLRAGQHRLGPLPAGLAEVGVQVDEAGQQQQAVGVDPPLPRRRAERAGRDDHAAVDADIRAGAVAELGSADDEAAHAARSPASTS
jgi:hypothetical protein